MGFRIGLQNGQVLTPRRHRRLRVPWRYAGWAGLLLALALPAAGDWLITLEGRLIETQGPWTIEGDALTYTDPDGEEHTLALDDVDLEASEETTALKAGKPYEPAPEEDGAGQGGRQATGEEPKIILYMTSLCQECTRAREILEDLGVEFVEKDIRTDPRAEREYRKIAGHGGGLPVIDVDGAVVFSNNPRVIRQRVEEMRQREAKAAAEAEAAEEREKPEEPERSPDPAPG